MKIHRIAIENLASLRGRQPDLELEGEPLRDAGLIAITGPTGAGKTTVLDAICLALYDRTPRQRARGQDPRELLSRGAGQGRVAVDLTLDDGRRWTAEWSVHRARNKPDGALQPSRQRILDRTTGEIVADGKTAVQRAVEKNLDLSFEQFTGVILLAQGEFATFLESSDAERSELLERLTGTEIYSRLGKAAFDRHKELRVKLEQEEKRFEGLAPMPEARRKALEQELDELEPSLARLDRHLATLEEKLAWVERRRTLADRTASTGESLEKARRRHLQAREDRSRLRNARRAMALRPALVSADEATRRARAASHALERERETAREQNLSARDAGRALLRNSVRLEQALEASRRALEEREAQGGEAASDRSALADLRDRRRDGEAEDRLASQESAAVTDALSAQKARTLEGEKADGVLAAARERQDSSSAALADLEARRKKALGSETRQGLVKRAVLLDRAVELHRQLAQADPELLAEAAEGERLAADRASRACQASETKLEAATRELAEHRQALGRVERRAEMARHRSELAPGEPCPLCGSLEHPGINEAGAEDGLAELRQAKGTLEDLEQALLEAQGAHLEAQEAWITARSARQRGEDRLLESQRRFSELGSGWMELRLQLADLPLDPQDIETLSLGGLRARAQERLETAEALDEEEVQLKAANESTTRARDDAERERAVALERTLEAEKQLRAAESRRAAQRERRREAWDRWHHAARDLAARCGLELAPDALGAARGAADLETELERRGRRYEAALQESERIGDLESRTRERRRDLLAELADEIPAKDEHSRTADSERQPLSDALGQALRRAERSRADARFAEERATQAERSASSARAEADEALSALENQLAESAFADAEALRRAALDPDALDALAESLRQLDLELERQRTEHHRSEADLEEHDEASDALGLDLEDAKEADFLDSLRAAARDVRGRHQQDTQRKLSLQLELRGDQERRKERRHSENRLADLRQRRERAGRLAQLIGQKDGGKFRRFAQQLNLEQLLELANLRLERLAPRYGLARVEGSLDLQVIDRDMADELRPTSTLSGGESFLVSLALALALADLRRGQLRLGTLFLDEGFGSLDQDTLETALTTLEQLQAEQETQILIISHVGALQERIAHRIEVHKEGGGRSRLLLGLGDGVSAG